MCSVRTFRPEIIEGEVEEGEEKEFLFSKVTVL